MAFINSPLCSAFFGESGMIRRVCPNHSHHSIFSPSTRPATLQMCTQPPPDIPDVLQKIIERKIIEVDVLKKQVENEPDHPISIIMKKRGSIERSKAFYDALNVPKGSLAVIAEIKRKSPSKGRIGAITNPGNLSRVYHEGGAAAISVLTDFEGFGGTMDDLRNVQSAQNVYKGDYPGPCPIIRKEFIIDEIQIAEAADAGASAVLLIVAALGKERTKKLLSTAHEYGLDALVEVHDESELDIAIEIGAEIIGVNNRDLRTFKVSLDNSFNLVSKIPQGVVKVAESGIKDCLDAWKLRDAGFNAVLVGETLVTAAENSSDANNSYTVGYNKAIGYIKAYRSKGSVEFGNSDMAAVFGRGEGAKETLGELSI